MSIVLLDQILVSGIRFALGLVVAKSLGAEGFGTYVILWSFVLFITSIHMSFILSPMMTLGTRSENISSEYYHRMTLSHQLVFTLIVPLLLLLMIWVWEIFGDAVSWELQLGLVVYSMSYFFYEYYRKRLFAIERHARILVVDSLVHTLSILSVFSLILFEIFSLKYFFLATGITFLFGTSIFLYLDCKLKPYWSSDFYNLSKETIKFGRPLMDASIMQFISGHMFVYVSAWLLGASAAGEIGAARYILGPLVILFMTFDNFMPTRANKALEVSSHELINYVTTITRKYGVYVIGICILIFMFSDMIVLFIYGSEYIFAGYLVKWFAVSHVIMFLSKPLSIYVRTVSKERLIRLGSSYSLIASLLLTYPLILFFEYNGAMQIMLLQQMLILHPLALYFVKKSNIL